METLISLLIFVLVFGLVAYLIFWFMGYLNVPEPIRKVVTVVVIIIGIIMLLGYLPGIVGPEHHSWHLPWSH